MMNVIEYFRLQHEYLLINRLKSIKKTYQIFVFIYLLHSTSLIYRL